MNVKKICVILMTVVMLFTSGCWDMVEIEKRAIIGALTIDLAEKEENKDEGNENNVFCEERPDKLKVTYGVNNPAKAAEGGEGAFIPVTVEGANIPDTMEELGSRISRIPFYGVTRLLVLTEKVIKDEKMFKEILDEFERKTIINQQMKIVVFRGEPEKIPEVDPRLETTPSAHVVGIMENSRVLADTVSMTLNELLNTIRGGEGTAAIPVLEIEEGKEPEFKISKLALIKDYKLLSYLDAKYIKSYKIITKTIDNGRKLVNYKGTIIPFFIFTSTRRIWLEEEGEKLKYLVRVELEGDIEAYEFDKELFDSKIIQEIASELSKSLEYELETTTKYFQNEVGVDYLKFGDYTHKYHNKIFKKYENNWNEAFKNAEINYEVETEIRRIGTSKK